MTITTEGLTSPTKNTPRSTPYTRLTAALKKITGYQRDTIAASVGWGMTHRPDDLTAALADDVQLAIAALESIKITGGRESIYRVKSEQAELVLVALRNLTADDSARAAAYLADLLKSGSEWAQAYVKDRATARARLIVELTEPEEPAEPEDTIKTYGEVLKALRDDGISTPRIAASARKLADGLAEDGYVDDEKVERLAEKAAGFIGEVEDWSRTWGAPVDTLTVIEGIRSDCAKLEIDLTDLADLDELLASEAERISEDLKFAALAGDDEDEGEEDEDSWLYDAPAPLVIIPITPLPGADTTEFPTRAAALSFLNGCWLSCYGPQSALSDADVCIVAANYRVSENADALVTYPTGDPRVSAAFINSRSVFFFN